MEPSISLQLTSFLLSLFSELRSRRNQYIQMAKAESGIEDFGTSGRIIMYFYNI
jgi:hypothetical protein